MSLPALLPGSTVPTSLRVTPHTVSRHSRAGSPTVTGGAAYTVLQRPGTTSSRWAATVRASTYTTTVA